MYNPNLETEKLRKEFQKRIYAILTSKDLKIYMAKIGNQLLMTGSMEHIDLEDTTHDLFIALSTALDKKLANGATREELLKYFTLPLAKTSTKHYFIDIRRSKAGKLLTKDFANLADHVIDVVRNTSSPHLCSIMDGYLSQDNHASEGYDELLDEVRQLLTPTQVAIFNCHADPSTEFIKFFQFYNRDLGITSESEIIAKFVGVTNRVYYDEFSTIKSIVREKLDNGKAQ